MTQSWHTKLLVAPQMRFLSVLVFGLGFFSARFLCNQPSVIIDFRNVHKNGPDQKLELRRTAFGGATKSSLCQLWIMSVKLEAFFLHGFGQFSCIRRGTSIRSVCPGAVVRVRCNAHDATYPDITRMHRMHPIWTGISGH